MQNTVGRNSSHPLQESISRDWSRLGDGEGRDVSHFCLYILYSISSEFFLACIALVIIIIIRILM